MIRPFNREDIEAIQAMNKFEGWDNLVARHEQTLAGWENSNISFVYEVDGEVLGAVRALTDGHVSLYVCELIVRHDARKRGIGSQLLEYVHELYPDTRMELIATSSSKSYYEEHFRPFYGFRRTFNE